MPIKYLKSPVASSALNTETIGPILANLELINRALTISNTTISMSGVTNAGALVVGGGVGIGGNLNVGQNIYAAGNISAYDASLSNSISVTGHINAYDLNFSGSLVGDNGSFVLIQTDEIQASESVFSNLTVTDTATLNRLTGTTGTITTLTATSTTTTNLTAATTLSTLLRVDTVTPRSGSQINFGSVANIRIAGGQSGFVLGTDGNGNLSWLVGPAGLTYANGIERVVNTVGLTATGITAGTYNRVTVDQFGRITAGVLRPDETLDSVAARNAETSQQIYFTNTTESTDTETGAVTISGGLGVAGTINAAKLVAANIDVTNTLRVLDNLEITKTLNLTSGSNFQVPVKFSSTNLADSPVVGAIEFDGNFFYITTLTGRQVLQTRESSDPITGTTNVRAVALYNIDLTNPSQLITVSGNLVNAWDNVILNANDRVLLANQTSASENGIYIWRGNGITLERAGDFNTLTGVFSGTIIFVTEGALYANGVFQIVTPNPITVGTTALSIIETVNKNVTGITNLTKDAVPGLLVKTSYGNYSLRNLVSNVSWLSITNPAGQAGNITISANTIPVSAGGTGRTNIWGYLRGSGSSILSSNTVPVSHISGIGTIATQNANAISITGGNITVTDITANNNANIGGNLSAGNITTTGTVTTQNLSVSNITVGGSVSLPGLFGNAIALGANSAGSLSTNAVSVSTTYNVTDTIALMNVVLGKLVPPPPPAFPGGQSISISGLTSARMADFVQTDNTASGGKNISGGSTVSKIRRAGSYATSTITTVGPGDTGNVSVYKNGTLAGTKQMIGGSNGTFDDLLITNNQDYHNVLSSVNPNFWFSFNAAAAGSVAAGWNEVYIVHSAADSTNTADWYYDSSTPGTPAFSLTSINLDSNVSTYSSTIPHFTTSTRFNLQFYVNRLSGDTYPTTDTFITGTSGGAFDAPASLTYSQAGISTPLTRNLYVASGSTSALTYANIRSGFGSSSSGPALSCTNSYNTGTHTFNPGVTVLYKTGTSNQIEETSIPVNSVGTGSGNAVRIINPGSTDTPSFNAGASAFNSQSSTLTATDATVVAAVLKHDVTNYSTGYLPVGPNLSVGRSGAQYFTFKFARTVVSKFDVKYTGTIAGLWIALPGSSIDTASTLNGWLTLDTAYNGAGVPGAGTGGNGSNGAAVGGVAVLNSAQTNKRVTATFGTVSSSSTATNEIYVRVKLILGQTVTALSIEAASN